MITRDELVREHIWAYGGLGYEPQQLRAKAERDTDKLIKLSRDKTLESRKARPKTGPSPSDGREALALIVTKSR